MQAPNSTSRLSSLKFLVFTIRPWPWNEHKHSLKCRDLWDLLSLFACFISTGMFLHIPLVRGWFHSRQQTSADPASSQNRRGPSVFGGKLPIDRSQFYAHLIVLFLCLDNGTSVWVCGAGKWLTRNVKMPPLYMLPAKCLVIYGTERQMADAAATWQNPNSLAVGKRD